jgi:hypothetical protein
MIVNLKESPMNTKGLTAIERRQWYYQMDYSTARIATPQPTKVEFTKIMYAMPFLFVSGIFTGIAIMLALTK